MNSNEITMTTIIAKKNLIHSDGTRSFTKGKEYSVNGTLHNTASLIDARTKNDQDMPHGIGMWWRSFKIKK